MNKNNSVAKNIIFGFGTKIATLAVSFFIPRLFIVSFGSEINGLISTITQIFTYLALLEAGIGNATVNALYLPLREATKQKANEVLTQARKYYRKVTTVYIVCVLLFSVVYPIFVDSEIDKITVFLIIIFQAIANCLSYFFCAVYNQLLMASGKRYITDNIAFIVHISTTIARIILIVAGFNVIAVQGVYLLLTLIRIPCTIVYCRKKYPWISFDEKSKENLLHERSAFIVHEISSTIFSSTDVFIISTFCSFSLASVYTVYNLVFSSLNSMINTANQGLGFILGQNINKESIKFEKIYDAYSMLYTMVVFIFMTTATILIVPFVRLYTEGANDINYVMQGLPILFALISLMSGYRAVAARLITIAGHVKATQNRSIIEMIINLSTSLVLVNIFGIYGVLFGTIIALIYRANDIVIYANKMILKRSPWKEYKNIVLFFVVFIGLITLSNVVEFSFTNYMEFFIYAILITVASALLYFIVSILFNLSRYRFLKEIIIPSNSVSGKH